MSELLKLEELAESALVKAIETPRPLEMRRSIEQLLAKLKEPNPEVVRTLRAVESLEHIGSSDARKLLAVLAGGGPGLRLTEAARGTLDRCEKRDR